MTANEAVAQKIVAHHRAMAGELAGHVQALGDAVRAGRAYHQPAKDVANYLAAVVFPHAEAEEVTLYKAAQGKSALAALVQAMTNEHGNLKQALTKLVASRDGLDAYGAARALNALFDSHVQKENESLLPHLVEDPAITLEDLLEGMHEHIAPDHKEDERNMDNDEQGMVEDAELDVRELPHAQRHTTIFGLLDHLKPGQALVITVDHDPQPLKFQLNAIHPDEFSWDYLEQGPSVFRVAIRKKAAS